MKKTITTLAAALLFLNYLQGSAALANFPDMHDAATRQSYIRNSTEKIKNAPDDYEGYMARAYVYLHDNKLQESLVDLNKANELQPNNIYVLSLRGEVNLALKDYKAAIADESAAIELKPQEAGLYSNRGLAFMFSSKFVEARKDAIKALKLDPQLSPAHELMGEISYREGKFADCIKYCNEAIKRSSTDADAFYYRGCAYEKLGNKAQGDIDKSKAVRMGYHGQMLFQMAK